MRARLRRIRWRIRAVRSVDWGSRALFWAVLVGCGLVTIERVLAVGLNLDRAVGAVLVGATALGMMAGFLRRVTTFEAALTADERLGLKERLSSALTLSQVDHPMVRALEADAAAHARRIRAREAVPFSVPRRTRFLPLAVGILVMLGLLLPSFDVLRMGSRREAIGEEEREIQQHADRLKEVERRVAASQEIRPATAVAELAQEIKRISEELKKERLERTQALAKVSTLSDKVEAERRRLLEKTGLNREMSASQDFGSLEEFANSLKDQDFAKAAQKLKELAQGLESGKLSEAQKGALAADLEAAARLLRENPELSRALAEMALSLRSNEIGALNLALDDALATLADLEDLLGQLALLEEILQGVGLSKLALAGQISACTACKRCGRCSACGGTGKCPGCGGSGSDGQGGSCSVCGGSGVCPFCGGLGLCAACGGQGYCSGVGMGAGRGIGPRPTDDSALTSFQDQRIAGELRPGKILAAIKVRGQQVRGEPEVEVVEAFVEVRQNAEQALSRETIPVGMKDLVKAYFDAIDPNAPAAASAQAEVVQDGDLRP